LAALRREEERELRRLELRLDRDESDRSESREDRALERRESLPESSLSLSSLSKSSSLLVERDERLLEFREDDEPNESRLRDELWAATGSTVQAVSTSPARTTRPDSKRVRDWLEIMASPAAASADCVQR